MATALSPAAARDRVLKLDREEDDHGDFYVAFVIDPRRPNDFETFGSRVASNAERLARMYAKQANLRITKVVKTKNMPDDSGTDVGLTRRGALIAAGAGAALGTLGSLGYLKVVEQRAFDRGFLDAQQGQPYAPAMMSGMGAEGLLPDWLTYLGIGAGTSAIAASLSEIAQSPFAAKRIRDAYSKGYEAGGGSDLAGDDKPAPPPPPPQPSGGTATKIIQKAGDTLLRRLGSPFILIPESILKSTQSTLAGEARDLGRDARALGGYNPRRRRGAMAGDGPPPPAPPPAGSSTAVKAVEKAGDTLLRRLGGPFLLIPESLLKSFRHESTLAGSARDLGRDARKLGGTGRERL